jgi:hypothetical protein
MTTSEAPRSPTCASSWWRYFLLHGWQRNGNCAVPRASWWSFRRTLALLPAKHALRLLTDARQLLRFLEKLIR